MEHFRLHGYEGTGTMNPDTSLPLQDPESQVPCPSCGTPLNFAGFQPLDNILCPVCGTAAVVPAEIDHYRLIHLLGEGSMGRVYLAKDLRLEREVAIKLLRKDLASTPRMWTMLEKEARSAAGIQHNHVVQIYSMGKTRGRPFIVMELVPDMNLEARIRSKLLTEQEALRIGIEVLQGLKAAQIRGLLHGDIKPANILLTAKGSAKVVDFGLSRILGQEKSVERWGTPYYLAPEKAARRQEDIRSDMYSLGSTLFHCLAGTAPFEGKTGEEVIRKSLSLPTPWLPELRGDVSEACGDILYRMMQRDPARRFQDFNQAIAAMRSCLQGTYRPGGWSGAHKLKSNSLFSRLRRAWKGEDAGEEPSGIPGGDRFGA